MDIQAEKLQLIEELARIQDVDVIEQVKRLLMKKESSTVGFELDGQPITREQLIARIEAAEIRIDNGEFVTQEDIEREAENW